MSKITEIKNQYPELNISIIDVFLKMDNTKTNKYLPLLCKLFSHRFQPDKLWGKMDYKSEIEHIIERMENLGFDCGNMSDNEIYSYYFYTDVFNNEDIRDVISFRKYNERGLIKNNDITTYQTFDEIRSAVGLALLKEDEKMMKSQIIKEYEDDVWLALRPLTFGASSKYGAATKWCTTYQNDKQYFERYWNRGILVYFINKVTGLKFALFKSLDNEKELSFWNAADSRVDFLELEIEDYMFPIVKKILKSDKTNKNLCSVKIQIQVEIECSRIRYKKSQFLGEISMEGNEDNMVEEIPMQTMEIEMNEPEIIERQVIQLRPRTVRTREQLEEQLRTEVAILGENAEVSLRNLYGGIDRLGESFELGVSTRGNISAEPYIDNNEDCQAGEI
jgi:uncharacterized membrane protein